LPIIARRGNYREFARKIREVAGQTRLAVARRELLRLARITSGLATTPTGKPRIATPYSHHSHSRSGENAGGSTAAYLSVRS
jgi:hypothetical protein